MPRHEETQISPYTPAQLFALVADVEKYPEFLPWCRAARILKHEGEHALLAELVISYKHFRERYTSRVTLFPAQNADEDWRVEADMVEGPFEFLINRWRFTQKPGGGAKIEFLVDFRFRSRLLESLLGGFFGRASAKMAQAFKERADALYGSKSLT